ncbi:ABC transporter substrate-binding protein [Pontibacter sp. CAU 1760]
MLLKKKAMIQVALLLVGGLVISFILYRHFYFRQALKGYYTIGVIYNSTEMTPADMRVMKTIIKLKLNQINERQGVGGKVLRVVYLDDEGSPEVARRVVAETIDDPLMIGYVGCWSSTRSKAIAEVVGPARIPFIGGYALTPLFRQYPTMYTAEQSILDVGARFRLLLKEKSTRPAFIGRAGDLYSQALLEVMHRLAEDSPGIEVVMEKWLPLGYEFSPTEIDSIASQLSREQSDLLVLSFGGSVSAVAIAQLREAGVTIPIFTALGDLGHIIQLSEKGDLGELYDLNVASIPGTFNLRLHEQVSAFTDIMGVDDLMEFSLSFGARFADSIGMLAAAGNDRQNDSDQTIQEKINEGMKAYIGGKKIYRGWYADWFFTDEQAIAGDVLLAWKPKRLFRQILAPRQFMRINDTLQQVPVLFTHVDMVQINQVSDTEGSFYATFYLEITATDAVDIEQIDFSNAARSEMSHAYLLDVKQVSYKYTPGKMPHYNYMFKVSGKFLYEPDLQNYPFDEQKFAIQLQPVNAINPFLIQPSTATLNDSVFDASGWKYRGQFVGYDHDIISYINSFDDAQRTLPFYKFSYTYVMARAKADFFLKVLTPLLVILMVTYFSVFIPLSRFETLEAIQVTSLLASIALYFSTYKPEMEYATVSDKIFIFTYIMITSLIGTSILQYVNRKRFNTDSKIARIYQHYLYPFVIVIMTIFVVA